MPNNWYLWTTVLENSPESNFNSKEIKPVNLKGNQPWILIGRTDAEAEAPLFWSSDVKRQLIGKDTNAGKDWGQKERKCQTMRWWNGITDAMDMNLGKLQEMVRDWEAWHAAVHCVAKNHTWLGDWTTTTQHLGLFHLISIKWDWVLLFPNNGWKVKAHRDATAC